MTLTQKWVAFSTLIRKEVIRFMRIWMQTLLPPVITQSLFFIIFGTYIGSQINTVSGISYMSFIVPGLVMMAVINSSFSNVVSSFFSSKFQKNVEELIVSPTPNYIVVAGYVGGGMLRGLLVGLIIFGVSMLFAAPQVHNFLLILIFIILSALLFSLGGLINGMFAKKFDDVSIFPTFILTPLTYLGGVFYSIHSLPELWQTISRLNPIFYLIDGFRYGFFGVSDVNIWISLSVLIGFTIIALVLNLYLLKKGIGLKA